MSCTITAGEIETVKVQTTIKKGNLKGMIDAASVKLIGSAEAKGYDIMALNHGVIEPIVRAQLIKFIEKPDKITLVYELWKEKGRESLFAQAGNHG